MEKDEIEIRFEDGRVHRRFTKQWSEQGIINMHQLPSLVQSLVSQRQEMIDYIEVLHNNIDYILRHNRCCDMLGCLTAGCTSDHK